MFVTGTDEHGQKIEQKAKEAGLSPKEFVDRIVESKGGIRDLWKLMNISHDRFVRTTDDYHVTSIQHVFRKMYENGDIYKGKYKGKYCTPCESFWTESQLVDGKCPDCGWLVIDGGKMSKSKGNVVDPYELADKYGVDTLRFFLLRSFPFGSDGNFTNELLINTINTDLGQRLCLEQPAAGRGGAARRNAVPARRERKIEIVSQKQIPI